MTRLRDKVAIVTGGANGIGRATALRFAQGGVRVFVADIDESGGQQTAELIKAKGYWAEFITLDVTSAGSCEQLVRRVVDQTGQLDIAFNNAGVVGYPLRTADYGKDNWQRVLDVNLNGVFNCMSYELPAMSAKGGVIVNTASIMGLIGAPGGSAYCASKHGVIGLTKAAALEYGREGIRVNAICPGYIATDMTVGKSSLFNEKQLNAGLSRSALRRLAKPKEVADLVLWLCSDKATFITGASIPIDGGYTAA